MKSKHKYIISLLLGLILLATPSISSASDVEPEPFNPKEIIFEHLQDSYWWHITTIHEQHISIYLPVIVRSESGKWHLFSSEHVAHGESYKGFYIPETGENSGKIMEEVRPGESVRPWDVSITKNALALMINGLILIVIFLFVAHWYKKSPKHAVPGRFVGFIEMIVINIEDEVIRKSIGSDYARYSPYLLTAFFFILVNNIMGLIPFFPGGANTTGNISITLVLSICTMLAVNLFGNKEYWKEILWPDVPVWMKVPIPLMPVIEVFGIISKPFALMIRLFANIMAGHTVILALTFLIFITAQMGVAVNMGMTVFSVFLSVFMSFLEILVAYIQAYVFTMLSAVFIGLSRPKPHTKESNQQTLKSQL